MFCVGGYGPWKSEGHDRLSRRHGCIKGGARGRIGLRGAISTETAMGREVKVNGWVKWQLCGKELYHLRGLIFSGEKQKVQLDRGRSWIKPWITTPGSWTMSVNNVKHLLVGRGDRDRVLKTSTRWKEGGWSRSDRI